MKIAVIGAGHNGLISAIYLAQKGFDVSVYELRDRPGGMAYTEIIKGVKVSRASYVLGLMPERIIRETGVNIPIIRQDPFQVIYHNNKAIPFWRDKERRLRELEKAGEERYKYYEEIVMKFKRFFEEKIAFTDEPPSLEVVKEEAEKEGLEELFEEPLQKFVSNYISPELEDFFIYPDSPNELAFMTAYRFSLDWSYVRGGTGTIGEKLAERARELGVKIFYNTKVTKILTKDSRVVGIETNGKQKVELDAVISAISPIATSMMLDEGLKGIKDIKLPHAGWRKYNIILKEMPSIPDELKPFAHSIIDYDYGEMTFPSLADDSLGGLVITLMGSIDENPFKGLREKALIIDTFTPEELEERFNVPYGYLDHLPMRGQFLLDKRPKYRTEILGLYLSGVGTYPGGQITGIPGRNAAFALIKDYESGKLK
ncbi:MAG: NAD(P)/FAD-dependent oxidoreductase [Sulfolobaceae archaeon]|nr:NAD(P)/FAD-dependent oxidoreductase [Sulfolobaceae archaeon]